MNVPVTSEEELQRTFHDIPDSKATEAERTAYLMELAGVKGPTWDDLLKSKRVLIVSEAGAGKTYECRARRDALWAAGEPAFYVELADLARNNLRDLLSHDETVRFEAWLSSQSDTATFFLDSVDELKLSLGSFEQALKRLAKAVAGQLSRIRVIITSRPIPIDEQLFQQILPVPTDPKEAPTSQAFADIAMARKPRDSAAQGERVWRNVALLPLSNDQIKAMARHEGVDDADALLADIKQRNAAEFVRRPQDLIELCADWREHRRIRSHRDQVQSNVTIKLKPRSTGPEKAALSPDKALEGARRLALASTLTRKLTLRHSAEADRGGDTNDAPLDPATILHDWEPDERTTLLERSLFGFASYGRVRFHHRSVIEYLAAEHLLALRAKGMPVSALKRILFTTTAQGLAAIKPSQRAVAAWMARSDDVVFAEVLAREPDVLLSFGDPESLSPAQRQQALRAWVQRHGGGGWRGVQVPYIQLHRFASPDLGPEVKRLWEAGIENQEVREILLTLIGLGRMTECADIAHAVAINEKADHSERTDGLDALVLLNDPRLSDIAKSLGDDAWLWPGRLTESALIRLFPAHLSVESLSKALGRIDEKRHSNDLAWNLPRLIENSALTPPTADALREGLTALAATGLTVDENKWPQLISKRPFVLPALAAITLHQIQNGVITAPVLKSAAIAIRLNPREDTDEPAKKLSSALEDLSPDQRRLLFEVEDAWLGTIKAQSDPFKRYARAGIHGALQLRSTDAPWIAAWLGETTRPVDERLMMFEAAIRCRSADVSWDDHLIALGKLVEDLPQLESRLDDLAKPRKPDPTEERWQKESAKRKEDERRRDLKAHASWVQFWNEIVKHPDIVFADDRSENTAWNLWRAMERDGVESRASGWNRRFIESHFGKTVADRLRLAVMAFWRKDKPTLRSERKPEEKGTYYTTWQLGLAGIAAEAEDPDWAGKISEDEAKLALRYAPIELNSFPSWLEGLAAKHPGAIDAVLGAELTSELAEPPTAHSSLLQDIEYATPAVAQLFVPRLFDWLETGGWRSGSNEDEAARASRLRRVVQALLANGTPETVARIRTIAQSHLNEGAHDVLADVWLPILLRLSPEDGVEALGKTLGRYPPSKFGKGTIWFSTLFGDRHHEGATSLSAPGMTPALLLRLARLAYEHVRPADDMVRDSGSYSPNTRDHAERGRGNILNALLSASGPEGWASKIELSQDPLFSDLKDRLLALARERATEEADSIAVTEPEVVSLDRYGELPPLTRDEIFTVMTDRLDDLDDALLRDDSPRSAWALIDDERVLRKQIARELRRAANGVYTVDQEAVTEDEKETDVRLRSTGSEHEAVIELKIGEKDRSAADLRAALKDQLVTKYMAPENNRAGCLLISVASDRTWRHPDTGASLDLAGVIAMLSAHAAQIETEMGRALRLTVRGLDLRPRLPTEKALKAGKAAT